MEINNKQSKIIIIAIIIITITVLFPPWKRFGYHFLFLPPSYNANVNFSVLFLQWLLIVLIAGIIFYVCRNTTFDRNIYADRTIKKDIFLLPLGPKNGIIDNKDSAPSGNAKELIVNRSELKPGIKLCPSCKSFQDASETNCPYCGYDLNNVEIYKKFEKSKKVDTFNVNKRKKLLGVKYHPWRRYFARYIDSFTLWMLPFYILDFVSGKLFNPDIVVEFLSVAKDSVIILSVIILSFIILTLWITFEATLLSATGTTPGKWLFGISVLTINGDKLSFSKALKRTLLVSVQGLGLGIPFIGIFTMFFAYRRLTRTGTTLWDQSISSKVIHKKWGPLRVVICTLCVLFISLILGVLNLVDKKDKSSVNNDDPYGIYKEEAKGLKPPATKFDPLGIYEEGNPK